MSTPLHEFTTEVPHWKPRVKPIDLAQASAEQLDALMEVVLLPHFLQQQPLRAVAADHEVHVREPPTDLRPKLPLRREYKNTASGTN